MTAESRERKKRLHKQPIERAGIFIWLGPVFSTLPVLLVFLIGEPAFDFLDAISASPARASTTGARSLAFTRIITIIGILLPCLLPMLGIIARDWILRSYERISFLLAVCIGSMACCLFLGMVFDGAFIFYFSYLFCVCFGTMLTLFIEWLGRPLEQRTDSHED